MSVALETSSKTEDGDNISTEHTSASVLCDTGGCGDFWGEECVLFYSEAGIWWLVLVVIFTQTEYALRREDCFCDNGEDMLLVLLDPSLLLSNVEEAKGSLKGLLHNPQCPQSNLTAL